MHAPLPALGPDYVPPVLCSCRIVLENSGVAEPQNIRDQFNEAAAAGHPLLKRVELDTLVTLVDSSSFVKDYASK
jgi:G3E family GTPase